MAASQSGVFSLQEFSDIGAPLVGGRLYTYVYGTTTHKTAYTDKAGTIPHTYTSDGIGGQYIALNARGELPAPLYLAAGSYDIALKDASGATIWTRRADPVDDTNAALRIDLASTSDASKGAGMVGFSRALTYIGDTVGRWLSTLVNWMQFGAGAVTRSLADRAIGHVELLDFVPTALHASIADGSITTNLAPYLRAAIDSRSGAITVMLPIGTVYATELVFAGKSGVRIKGQGAAVSKYKFVNASGGIVFSGDAATTASLAQYESCALEDFEVVSSGSPATDPSIVVDLTSFSYSHFDIEIQTRRANAVLYYGQGNAGTAPYYNHIESTGLFGHTDYTQRAFKFVGGTFSGGSNGPNSNMIGPITRAASLDILAEIQVGQGNMFSNISGESIGGAYFILGGNAAVYTGTSTGSNGAITLIDTRAMWTASAFVNGAVQITAGTGQGQVRTIKTNTSTTLTLNEPWATTPDATSQYAIYEGKALKNKFVNVRAEGLSTLNPDFIYAFPGSDSSEFTHVTAESLGSGKIVQDFSGSIKNRWFSDAVLITQLFLTPGASANINAWPRSGVFGGIRPVGDYFLEWVKVEVDGTSHGGTATVTVDAGGSIVGSGDQTMAVAIPNGESEGAALSQNRTLHSGTNTALHINLQTDGAFSAGRSVTVALCISIVRV